MLHSIDLWFEYLLRFSHLVAGIAWIGSSFYFIWLDSSFEPPTSPRKNVEGEVFMVHGGFYYQVEKRKIYPGELPKVLHWFKWEATLTWVTGIFLLGYLYFLNGAALLIDPHLAKLNQLQAVALSVGVLVVAWFLYDWIWHPERGLKNSKIANLLSLGLFVGLVFFLSRIFSGRGAFLLVGAVLGSLMLLNVWVRILPGQAKMLREAQAGKVPDYSVSLKSKTRSVHNTYFIFPVLFIMLSNHYPQVYNHAQKAWLLILLSVAGALVRHAMVTKNKRERWTMLPAAILLFTIVALTSAPQNANSGTDSNAAAVTYEDIRPILAQRCYSCHSAHPTDDVFKVPQKGLILETEEQVQAVRGKIYLQVVQAESMPLANKTGMTKEERALVGAYLEKISGGR